MTPALLGMSPAQFILPVLGVDLPWLPNQVDAIGNFGQERFGEAESPVVVFVVRSDANRVAASVGCVVVGTILVDGPVGELEVSIGADRILVEEVRQTKLAEAHLYAAVHQKAKARSVSFLFVFA